MKIGLIGWYGHGNAGDERILYCLKRFFEGHEFFVTSSFNDAVKRIDQLNRCDYVLLGGGGLVLRGVNTYTELIRQIKPAFGCVGLGVEAYHDDNAEFIRALKEKAEFILVRDHQSREFLDNHFKVIVSSDLSFLYPFDIAESPESDTCGVNLRDWYFWNCEHGGEYYKYMMSHIKTDPKIEKDYPHAKWEPDKAFGIIKKRFSNLVPAPLYFGGNSRSDHVLLSKFFDKVDAAISLPDIYRSCRYFVGMRVHSLIFACQIGVPFVSLSYQPKNERFCKALELDELSVDLFNVEELDKAITILKNSYAPLREKLLNYRQTAHADIHSTMSNIRKLIVGSSVTSGIDFKEQTVTDSRKNDPLLLKPKVSIVLPTYNHLKFLPKAVDSILKQTYTDFELIIVNDGSTDGTREYLDNLKDKRVRVIHQENKRLPEALNAGFRTAGGELLTWISADNYCAPTFLETFVSALDANPDVGFAYSAYARIDENSQITKITKYPDMDYRNLLLKFQKAGGMASFMYRRACQEKVGLYDPKLTGAEDWDMWLRIGEHFKILYVPELLYYYRQHEDTMTKKVRPQIARSCQQVLKNAIDRLNWEKLYPSLKQCRDQAAAHFHAYLDFGTALIHSVYGLQSGTVCKLLEKAHSIQPDSLGVVSNLVVAYCRVGQWEKAMPLVKQMMKNSHLPKVSEICQKITEAYQANNPELLKSAYLFEIDKNNSELFKLMEENTVTSFSVADNTSEHITNRRVHAQQKNNARDGKLKILFYYDVQCNINGNSIGGGHIASLDFASMLVHHDPHIEVQVTGDKVNYPENYGVLKLIPLPSRNKRKEFLENYDIVFFVTRDTYFKDLHKPQGQRWVLYVHLWSVDNPDHVSLSRINDFDIVACLSEMHKSQMIKYNVPLEKLIVIPNLIDTTRFLPLGVERKRHSIMYAGNIQKHKCLHILIDAFRLVRQQVPDAELHVYGTGLMCGSDEYEKQLRSVNYKGLYFHGYVDNRDMPEVYSKHSLLCLPSKMETFPLVVLEAQACGCIPIAHDAGGTAAAMLDRETGLLYEPNTTEKLAESILGVINSVENKPSIRQDAVRFIQENFSTKKASGYISEILDKLGIPRQFGLPIELAESEIGDFSGGNKQNRQCEAVLSHNHRQENATAVSAIGLKTPVITQGKKCEDIHRYPLEDQQYCTAYDNSSFSRKAEELTPEKIELILLQYLKEDNYEESVKCVDELFNLRPMPYEIITALLNQTFDLRSKLGVPYVFPCGLGSAQKVDGVYGLLSKNDLKALQYCAVNSTGKCVNIGVFDGLSTYYLAKCNPDIEVFGIDAYQGMSGQSNSVNYEQLNKTQRTLSKLPNTHLIVGLSGDVAAKWNDKISFLLIDGDHRVEGALLDFEKWSPFVKSGGFIAVHDTYGRANHAVLQWRQHENIHGPDIVCQEMAKDENYEFVMVSGTTEVWRKKSDKSIQQKNALQKTNKPGFDNSIKAGTVDKQKIYKALNQCYFSEQCHEKETIEHLPEILDGVKTFVDIGASLGQYTFFANKYLENAKIFAIEADPIRIEELTRNCSEWELQSSNKLTALFAAASNKTERGTFHVTNSCKSGGLFKHHVSDKSIHWQRILVDCIALDDFFKDDSPDLIKIDVEGAELRVLKGATRILKEGKARFLIELHSWADPSEQKGSNEVMELMGSFGYSKLNFYGRSLFTKVKTTLPGDVRQTSPAEIQSDLPEFMIRGAFLPPVLSFELSNRCNVSCTMCDYQYEVKKQTPRQLSLEQLKENLAGVKHIKSAILSGSFCEPFLNKELIEIISFLKSKKASVSVISNGTLINEAMAEKIICAGLNTLYISLHGATKETAEAIMRRSNFDQIISNIRGLVRLKETFSSPLPVITIIFVGMKGNICELAELVGFMGLIGVKSVTLKSLLERQKEGMDILKGQSLIAYPDLLRREYLRAQITARKYGVRLSAGEPYNTIIAKTDYNNDAKQKKMSHLPIPKGKTRYCLFPFQKPYMGIKGSVGLCCSESGRHVCMGNANESGFASVWENEAYIKLRTALLTGEDVPSYCTNCERAPAVDPFVMQMDIALRYAQNNNKNIQNFVKQNIQQYHEYVRAMEIIGAAPIKCNVPESVLS